MQFFGECFVRFFTNYGYDKILRVAGRHFRDFLHSIDQLHDSTKFSFPRMKSPLFHVLEEDENGVFLQYKYTEQQQQKSNLLNSNYCQFLGHADADFNDISLDN